MYRYAVKLAPDPGGGFVVTFPAFPEAVTEGESREAALGAAVDCLDEAIAARIVAKESLPAGRARGRVWLSRHRRSRPRPCSTRPPARPASCRRRPSRGVWTWRKPKRAGCWIRATKRA
jgi:predicted RNase H-like HicB family nuclease